MTFGRGTFGNTLFVGMYPNYFHHVPRSLKKYWRRTKSTHNNI